jgi:hypothetical protein
VIIHKELSSPNYVYLGLLKSFKATPVIKPKTIEKPAVTTKQAS